MTVQSSTGSVQLPEQFGPYRIIKRLGQGGMGTVFLAHDARLNRHIALKVCLIASNHPQALERFRREAQAAASLRHANLCPVYDCGEQDGIHYFTMAHVEGPTLGEWLARRPSLSQREAALLTRKLALALQEAHARGVIHRDLKPANIILERGEPVILDFGLAGQAAPQGERLTKLGAVMGTPSYMAPEQVGGDPAKLGPRCDIYALGVILYEWLSGRVPVAGSPLSLVAARLKSGPKPPSELRADVNPQLEVICLKALAKKPEDRFPSMVEFARMLSDCVRTLPATAVSAATKPAKPSLAAATQFVPAPPTLPEVSAAVPKQAIISLPKGLRKPASRPWIPLLIGSGVGLVLLAVIIGIVWAVKSKEPSSSQSAKQTENRSDWSSEAKKEGIEPQRKIKETDLIKPDPIKPDPIKPDPIKPDPIKPDPIKPDPIKPDPIKPDPIKECEAVVAKGLQFLSNHQAPDGHWSMHEFDRHAHKPVKMANGEITYVYERDKSAPGTSRNNDIAGTAFGLLPFLAAGHTQNPVKDAKFDYSKNVKAGLLYLIKQQEKNKDGYYGGDMYAHGLATITMCEAYGLTADNELKISAQRALNYIEFAQGTGGGWRYGPKADPGDTSVTGWQLTALKSGQMAGLTVKPATLKNVERYLDSCESTNKGGYGYVPGGGETVTMTAVGLLCRQHLGVMPRNPGLLLGVERLEKSPPSANHSIYYLYYATQVMHHMGGENWRKWNLGPDGDGKGGIHDTLISLMDKGTSNPDTEGSWVLQGAEGRLMSTSLALLTLEIQFHHLPLFRRNLPAR